MLPTIERETFTKVSEQLFIDENKKAALDLIIKEQPEIALLFLMGATINVEMGRGFLLCYLLLREQFVINGSKELEKLFNA